MSKVPAVYGSLDPSGDSVDGGTIKTACCLFAAVSFSFLPPLFLSGRSSGRTLRTPDAV